MKAGQAVGGKGGGGTMDLDGASKYWPVSVTATVLVWLGYLPEFWRLWRERRSSEVGVWMWVIWIVSSGLSVVYASLSGAAPLVILNLAVVWALTVLAAVGNLCVRVASAMRSPLPLAAVATSPPQA